MWSARQYSSHVEKQGQASNFAQTCNLLSRYVKEKGTLRGLNLEIGGKIESLETLVKSLAESPEEHSPIITVEETCNRACTSKSKTGDSQSQMTVFYSGKVWIFEDYPAAKVKEVMSLAKKSSSQMSYGIKFNTNAAAAAREGLPLPQPNLPIARRSSLDRFIDKRKHRAVTRGPYHNYQEHHAPSFKDQQQIDLNTFPQLD